MEDFDLFKKWASKTPKYDKKYSDNLFDKITKKGGGSDKTQKDRGKLFNTNYELYIYCFFLGLYNNEKLKIPVDSIKHDFGHPIQHWGSKGNKKDRGEFTVLQESIFIACVAKTEIDFIELEKGSTSPNHIVDALIETLESYTNGGLLLLQEEMDKNVNFTLLDMAFLDLLFKQEIV